MVKDFETDVPRPHSSNLRLDAMPVFNCSDVHHLLLKQQSDGIGGNAFRLLDLIFVRGRFDADLVGSNFRTVAGSRALWRYAVSISDALPLPRDQYFHRQPLSRTSWCTLPNNQPCPATQALWGNNAQCLPRLSTQDRIPRHMS